MPPKILVVDDEPDVGSLIRQKFRKKIRDKEYRFIFASNGVEALQKLQDDGDIDIVLSDINMPEMDGLTLLSQINDLNVRLKAVIITAYGDMENIRTAMNRGAHDFLTKPIDFQDLEITINKTLQELSTLKQALKARDELVSVRHELDVATRIQRSMLPQKFPPFPEKKEFEIYAEMKAAEEVGGDFYDFFLIDEERLGFVIGDVSGKGIPAAMFMAVSITLLKATALRGVSPSECLQQVNNVLYLESVSSMFVTVFYGMLNTRTGELEYCNGGHNPPYLLSGNVRVELLENISGLVLGAMENTKYEEQKILLKPGETLFLYTDGVTEAMDVNDNEFEMDRLAKCLQRVHGLPLTEIIQQVVSEVESFSTGVPQADDITILALKYFS